VQRVRASAARLQCQNNLKEIGVATHAIHSVNKFLPPMTTASQWHYLAVRGPYQGPRGYTVFNWILPYLEKDNLFRQSKRDVNTIIDGGNPAYAQIVPTYQCPMEPSPSGVTGMGVTTNLGSYLWAIGNYGANYYVFGNPMNPDTFQGALEGNSRIPTDFPNGMSNLIFYTERYAQCGMSGVINSPTTFGSHWSDSNNVWRPVVCVNNVSQTPTQPGYYGCNVFQVTPNWITECDSSRAQTPHSEGINICLGDGSVRMVGRGISPATWSSVADPRSNVAPGDDWQ